MEGPPVKKAERTGTTDFSFSPSSPPSSRTGNPLTQERVPLTLSSSSPQIGSPGLSGSLHPLSPSRKGPASPYSLNPQTNLGEFKKPLPVTSSEKNIRRSSEDVTKPIEPTPRKLIKNLTQSSSTPLSSKMKIEDEVEMEEEQVEGKVLPSEDDITRLEEVETHMIKAIHNFGKAVVENDKKWNEHLDEVTRLVQNIDKDEMSTLEKALATLEQEEYKIEELKRSFKKADDEMVALDKEIGSLQMVMKTIQKSLEDKMTIHPKPSLLFILMILLTIMLLGLSVISSLWIMMWIFHDGQPPSFLNVAQHILYSFGLGRLLPQRSLHI